ncbi:hypothetical protein EJB05_39496, partial [Eragrostis curvula]
MGKRAHRSVASLEAATSDMEAVDPADGLDVGNMRMRQWRRWAEAEVQAPELRAADQAVVVLREHHGRHRRPGRQPDEDVVEDVIADGCSWRIVIVAFPLPLPGRDVLPRCLPCPLPHRGGRSWFEDCGWLDALFSWRPITNLK